MIDPSIWVLVDAHCAPRQAQVFTLHHRNGMSFRGIALHLGLNRTWITDAYDGACRNLAANGVRFTPDGRPYLEEQTPA